MNTEKKITAVEWLEEQMKTWGDKPRWMRDNIVEQAKAMEKQNLKDFYFGGIMFELSATIKGFEEYYTDTFKSE